MGYDSSQSGYHERKPGMAGLDDTEDWGDDYPKTFTVNLIWAQTMRDAKVPSVSKAACRGTWPKI